MPIWTHGEISQRDQTRPKWMAEHRDNSYELTMQCRYCASQMNLLAGKIPTLVMKGINASDGALLGCPVCGWWVALSLRGAAPYVTHDGGFAELRQISGVLKNLDLTDLSIPLHELRSYLIARYRDRFVVHPRKYEEIVGGVFSDFGYQVRVTSYSGDEGIDIFVLVAQQSH